MSTGRRRTRLRGRRLCLLLRRGCGRRGARLRSGQWRHVTGLPLARIRTTLRALALAHRLLGILRVGIDGAHGLVGLRRLLRRTNARRVVFSASGLREGWFMRRMPAAIREQEPLHSAAWELAARHGRGNQ